jgi:toxin FitB
MFLLDTNTVSELKKVEQGRADLNVVRWNESTDASQHWLSAITIL